MTIHEPAKRMCGKPLQVNSMSERIIQLRANGLSFKEAAASVGTTENSARVLYHKRRHLTRRFSALNPDQKPLPLDGRGGRRREPQP